MPKKNKKTNKKASIGNEKVTKQLDKNKFKEKESMVDTKKAIDDLFAQHKKKQPSSSATKPDSKVEKKKKVPVKKQEEVDDGFFDSRGNNTSEWWSRVKCCVIWLTLGVS